MWSVGCIVVELVTGTPVFRANTELDTFRKQVDLLGTSSHTDLRQKAASTEHSLDRKRASYRFTFTWNGALLLL